MENWWDRSYFYAWFASSIVASRCWYKIVDFFFLLFDSFIDKAIFLFLDFSYIYFLHIVIRYTQNIFEVNWFLPIFLFIYLSIFFFLFKQIWSRRVNFIVINIEININWFRIFKNGSTIISVKYFTGLFSRYHAPMLNVPPVQKYVFNRRFNCLHFGYTHVYASILEKEPSSLTFVVNINKNGR